jgi:putative membrane protein
MLSAFSTSVLFFASYLVYHFKVGSVKFLEEGIIKGIYLVILSTHSVFAIIIVPLILITLYLAITEQFSRHKNIAKITLPLWLYVNISGIIVYFLLYV